MLTISGYPSEEILTAAWEAILDEYSTLIKSDRASNVFDLYKKIIRAEWQMLFVDEALAQLDEEYSAETAQELYNLGYKLIEDLQDRAMYLKQIEFVRTESMTLVVQYNQYVAEYSRLNAGNTDAIKFDNMVYEKELVVLKKYLGYNIDKDKITVFEFCAIVNTFLEEVKSRKNGKTTL